MAGYEKVGYSQLMEMADATRPYVADDERARKLCDALQNFGKQARYQPYANFSYDVTMLMNKMYNSDVDYGTNKAYTKVYVLMHGEKEEYNPNRG